MLQRLIKKVIRNLCQNTFYENLTTISARQTVFKNVALVAEQQIPYYFTSPAFGKSSKARDQVGALFVNVFGNIIPRKSISLPDKRGQSGLL